MKPKSDLLIYITNPYGGYHRPFTDLGTCTTNREDLTGADLVVFTGGEDVSPAYYGEEPGPFTEWNPERDAYEKENVSFCTNSCYRLVGCLLACL